LGLKFRVKFGYVETASELKSDHFGIEILTDEDGGNPVFQLKSDHFGIEIYVHIRQRQHKIKLKSDHFGIEILERSGNRLE